MHWRALGASPLVCLGSRLSTPHCHHASCAVVPYYMYGIPKVVIGENRTFVGEEAWLRSRGVYVGVLHNDVCTGLLQQFIAQYPQIWCEDIGAMDLSTPSAGADTNV